MIDRVNQNQQIVAEFLIEYAFRKAVPQLAVTRIHEELRRTGA